MRTCRAVFMSLFAVLAHGIISEAYAQSLPTPEQFNASLKECAARKDIKLSEDTLNSIMKVYSSETARPVLTRSSEFLTLVPESDRLEAYRLHSDCIATILPELAPPVTVTYRICAGEYQRSCQPHDVYLYCYQSAADWAKSRCSSYKVQRLSTYGGNKCGYSLDAVICTGPK
ncbi:hypothetical protein V1277_006313 [Bradyrhizobium sp. AZCC 1588]